MYHTYYAAHIYPVWNIDILYICSQLLDVTSFSWFVVVSAACVYATGLLLLFAYIALLLLPLSFVLGVDAPSLSLAGFMIKAKAVRRGSLSFSLFVVASAACVYETGLLLVCACLTSAASVELLPRGSRVVASPRSLHEFPAA